MDPFHFQKPIDKDGLVWDILGELKLVEGSGDFSTMESGLRKMNRKELGILYHQLWELKRDHERRKP